jgi:hypothetical protein
MQLLKVAHKCVLHHTSIDSVTASRLSWNKTKVTEGKYYVQSSRLEVFTVVLLNTNVFLTTHVKVQEDLNSANHSCKIIQYITKIKQYYLKQISIHTTSSNFCAISHPKVPRFVKYTLGNKFREFYIFDSWERYSMFRVTALYRLTQSMSLRQDVRYPSQRLDPRPSKCEVLCHVKMSVKKITELNQNRSSHDIKICSYP